MDTKPLKEAGLTEGEIKVYMALLEVGSSRTRSDPPRLTQSARAIFISGVTGLKSS